MNQDEFFELSEGDIVRFRNDYVEGGFTYYKVNSITRATHEYGIPMPVFRVWLIPLDDNMKPSATQFFREIQAGDDDARRMELVTV